MKGTAVVKARENETTCKGGSCVDGDGRTNCPDEVIAGFDDGGGMFFKSEMRIKSNRSLRRKEGASDVYRWFMEDGVFLSYRM